MINKKDGAEDYLVKHGGSWNKPKPTMSKKKKKNASFMEDSRFDGKKGKKPMMGKKKK